MIISLQVTNENDMQFERNWIKSLQIGITLLKSLNIHTEKVDKYDNCQEKKRFTKNADLLRNSQYFNYSNLKPGCHYFLRRFVLQQKHKITV